MKLPSRRMRIFLSSAFVMMAAVVALPSQEDDTGLADAQAGFVPAPFRDATDGPEPVDARIALQRARSEELSWGRNPFRDPRDYITTTPTTPQRVEAGLPTLSGVSIIGDDRMAILDRQIVGVGDSLNSGHRVVAVTDRQVVLERDGRRFTLILEQ